jgi:hypothetical protein
MERIQSLEFGLEPDVSMHLFLNPEFTFDADLSWTASTQVYTRTSYTIPKETSSHYTIEQQIEDLVAVWLATIGQISA